MNPTPECGRGPLIVIAPGALTHEQTAREITERALRARGLAGEPVFPASADEMHRLIRSAGAATGSGAHTEAAPAATAETGANTTAGAKPGTDAGTRAEVEAATGAAVEQDANAVAMVAIVVPGPEGAPPHWGAGVIRVDFGPCPPDPSPEVVAHIRGRGLDGLRFAVESWYHRRFHPAATHAYGDHPEQRAELRMPEGDGPFPVAVLVHGGYWRSRWAADLMDAAATDLTARGHATWNIEYRRPDEHGWAATTADVATALSAVATIPEVRRLDLERVVVLGHSAGAQLALRAAADAATDPRAGAAPAPGPALTAAPHPGSPAVAPTPTPAPARARAAARVRPALAVALAGVLDLPLGDRRWLSEGAVSSALGGRHDALPDVYAAASPTHRLPLGVPQLVVCCTGDDPDLLEMSRAHAARASATADHVTVIEGPGDHFDVIDPATPVWRRICASITLPPAPAR
ncbi:alpha/beta fold hydrolase [Nocardiopsis mangrovi]|uniref:Alpha/beta fold hydrolase n=1 Tax=Nocardiopsis mangrovi TaxID=1179818 RepID=A0ABV9E296_9ACTN